MSVQDTPRRPPAGSGRRVAEVGVAVALSYVLAFFAFTVVPQGGQVSLDMVPILVVARWRGPGPGLLAGALYGVLHTLQEPTGLVHPVQILLDYPVAFGLLGLAGTVPARGPWGDRLGVLLGAGARYVAHVASGVIFLHLFLKELPGSPLLYSMTYNATYMVPGTALALVLVPPLRRALER